jgi:hypothetical protein
MRFWIAAAIAIEASSVLQLKNVTEGGAAFLQHHPRHRTTTTSEPDFWDEVDNVPREPSDAGKPSKTGQTAGTLSERSTELHDPQAAGGAQQDKLSDGMVELCKKPSFQVVLNPAQNTRALRFGDDAEAATRKKGKPLVQSMVRCVGTPQPSCLKVDPGCDLSPGHCPCEFRMTKLPPLDFEYNFMAREVLEAQEGSLEHAAKDLTLRREGAERWLGTEARDKMVDDRNKAGSSFHVALIGLGGGMLPQYLLQHSQDLSIDAVESSSDVVDVARAFFGIAQAESSGRLQVFTVDGLGFLQDAQAESYNSVVVDCFGAGRVPEGCQSKDFVQSVYRSLKSNSEALQNVIVRHPDKDELDAATKKDFDTILNNYYTAFGKEAVTVQKSQGYNVVIRARKE